MSHGYVRFIEKTQKYRARINAKNRQIYVGTYETEDLAWEGISDYRRKHYQNITSYNRLAKNPIEWNQHAKEVITKLSNLPNASKIDPTLFSSRELEEWL